MRAPDQAEEEKRGSRSRSKNRRKKMRRRKREKRRERGGKAGGKKEEEKGKKRENKLTGRSSAGSEPASLWSQTRAAGPDQEHQKNKVPCGVCVSSFKGSGRQSPPEANELLRFESENVASPGTPPWTQLCTDWLAIVRGRRMNITRSCDPQTLVQKSPLLIQDCSNYEFKMQSLCVYLTPNNHLDNF
ncbi:hypothetical protein PoB_006800400 [Plakobranchus ocellatus]|uniref:Uncharacterized protein n=1 Tax=Plakobranchus ocellatus TaxID=259542 RepID=A0AAV4DBA3_9GAST|nr:hypothetical protein PoB_006800400 [Plakobranchus ocellatus]